MNKLVVFQSKEIRRTWHGNEWGYSVADVCGALIDAGAYWRKLKQRLKQKGSEVVTIAHGLTLEDPGRKWDGELGFYIETTDPQVEMATETGGLL